MIKPEELKIGNLIHVPSTGQSIPVTAINMDLGVWVNRSLGVLGFDQVEPIPLTEEWLLKFGFENSYKSEYTITMQYKTYDGFYIKINNATGISVWYLGIPIRVVFIHQLQNLFFALCGEELTFNL